MPNSSKVIMVEDTGNFDVDSKGNPFFQINFFDNGMTMYNLEAAEIYCEPTIQMIEELHEKYIENATESYLLLRDVIDKYHRILGEVAIEDTWRSPNGLLLKLVISFFWLITHFRILFTTDP